MFFFRWRHEKYTSIWQSGKPIRLSWWEHNLSVTVKMTCLINPYMFLAPSPSFHFFVGWADFHLFPVNMTCSPYELLSVRFQNAQQSRGSGFFFGEWIANSPLALHKSWYLCVFFLWHKIHTLNNTGSCINTTGIFVGLYRIVLTIHFISSGPVSMCMLYKCSWADDFSSTAQSFWALLNTG